MAIADSLPALTLRQMQYFVTLAYSRSFTEAASTLAVTQPALTSAIRQIEFVLGGRLFDRSAHRLTLTEAGAAVLPLAEHLLNTAKGSFGDMASSVAAGIQTMRIGLIPSVAGRLLPVLADLQRQQPSLRFTLADLPNTELLAELRRGSLDFGIAVLDEHAKAAAHELEFHPILRDEVVAVLRWDDALAAATALDWAQLAGRPLAVFARGNVSESLLKVSGAHGPALDVAYRVEYTEPLYALVRAGLAAAIMPSLYTSHLFDPELKVLPLVAPRIERQIALVVRQAPARSPQVRNGFEWLKARMTSFGNSDEVLVNESRKQNPA